MTREEAIEKLKWLLDCNYVDSFEEEENEAIKLAIKALEQEPCEDAISRQAVHEAITRWAGSMSVLVALPTREVRPLLDSIHKLPSVNPQKNIINNGTMYITL